MQTVTITLDIDDAGYLAVAPMEHASRMRKLADTSTNIRDLLLKMCDRLERISERISREIDQ